MSSSRKYTSEGGLSTSELSKQIEERLEEHEEQINRLNMKVEYLENCNSRNKEFQQQLTQQTDEFIRVTTQRMESTEKRCSDVLAENQATVDNMLEDYAAMKLSVQQKMESVSSSVTKCRSDVIVIGDSFATRFQQLVRKHDAEQKKTQGILKVVPMIG
jgi:TolA-binding protein